MDRFNRRRRPRRDISLPNKYDTPLKKTSARLRNGKKRPLFPKRCETLHEVSEENDTDTVPAMQKHQVQEVAISAVGGSKLHPVRPASSENLRNKHKPSATPKNQRTNFRTTQANFWVNPIQRVLKSPLILSEDDTNLCETMTSPSVEPDTSSSCNEEDEDEEEDPTFSSSFSSPEIFRTDSDPKPVTYPIADPHLNSTLLDVSHARSLHMHLPPDLSTIIDSSMIHPDPKCEVIHDTKPGPENKTQAESSGQSFGKNSTPKLFKRRSIEFKKNVWFKSPIISGIFKVKDMPTATAVTIPNKDSSQMSYEKLMFDDTDMSSSKEEMSPLMVTLQRPVKSSTTEKVKFFDFVKDKDKNAFFKKMRERQVKLTTMEFYPFTSANE